MAAINRSNSTAFSRPIDRHKSTETLNRAETTLSDSSKTESDSVAVSSYHVKDDYSQVNTHSTAEQSDGAELSEYDLNFSIASKTQKQSPTPEAAPEPTPPDESKENITKPIQAGPLPHPNGSGYIFSSQNLSKPELLKLALSMQQETHHGKKALLTVQSAFHLGIIQPSLARDLDAMVNLAVKEGKTFAPNTPENEIFKENLVIAIESNLMAKEKSDSIQKAFSIDSPNGLLGDAVELFEVGNIPFLEDFKRVSKESIMTLSDKAIENGYSPTLFVYAEAIVNTGIEALVPAHVLEVIPFTKSIGVGAKVTGKMLKEGKDIGVKLLTPTTEDIAIFTPRLKNALGQSEFINSISTTGNKVIDLIKQRPDLKTALNSLQGKLNKISETAKPQSVKRFELSKQELDSKALDLLNNKYIELDSKEKEAAVLLVFSDIERAANHGDARSFNRLKQGLTEYLSFNNTEELLTGLGAFFKRDDLKDAIFDLSGISTSFNQEAESLNNGYSIYQLRNMTPQKILETTYATGINSLYSN